MKKKIYIAGKVTGEPIAECTMKFGVAQKQLTDLGFEAVNPLEVVGDFKAPWKEAMRKCIEALIYCDGVLLLPDCLDSRGAMIERGLAQSMDIPTFYDINRFTELWNEPTPLK